MRSIAPTRLSRRWSWPGLSAFGPAPLLNPRSVPPYVEEAIIVISGGCGRIECRVAERVGECFHHVRDAKKHTPGSGEPVG